MRRIRQYAAGCAAAGIFLLAGGCNYKFEDPVVPAFTAPKEPRLAALSAKLSAVLEDGELPALGLAPEKEAAFRDKRYGAAADYKAWINNVREYSSGLEEFQAYQDIAIVKELAGDPPNAPWRMEAWARNCLAEEPGTEPALQEACFLAAALPGGKTPQAVPEPTALQSPADLKQFADAVAQAAELVDKKALAQVSPAERRLLRFVIPWICRSGGTFVNMSKGAPCYSMEMMFAPNDGYNEGDKETSFSKTPVPQELAGMTALARYLHSLAGMPAPTDAFFLGESKAQPSFSCRVDFSAMRQTLSRLQPLLAPAALDDLARDIVRCGGTVHRLAAPVSGVTGDIITVMTTPYGNIIVGGPGPNRYQDTDALAILDIGGDDEYVWTKPEEQIGSRPLQIIIDFAGDDLYQTTGVGGPGAGLLGIGILIDRAGNDRYCQGLSPLFKPREQTRQSLVQPDPEGVRTNLVPFARLYGNPDKPDEAGIPLDSGFAFGAGFLGIGILSDQAGDDLYLGQKFAFGCGFWHGVGVLRDSAGNDVYATGLASIGAGINGAFGLLDDRAGDDHYQCLGTFESAYSSGQAWDNGYMGSGIGFGSSWRAEARKENAPRSPTLGGGLGLVHDASGNDMYVGSSFGAAAAYAGGAGAIVDDAGDDTYFVKRGPGGDNHSGWSGNHALGNGCHRGVGYLLDRAGNDRYSASGLGGGTAWDMASGFLIDLGGDDLMTDLHGKALAGNTGWGAAKGFAVSCHFGGVDTYERGTFGDAASIGDGYPGKGGNFSFFFDVGPEIDKYPQPDWNNRIRAGGVTWAKEADGKEYPQGIGLFADGPEALGLK